MSFICICISPSDAFLEFPDRIWITIDVNMHFCEGAQLPVCKICQDFLSRYYSRLCFCAVMSVFCSSQEFLPLFVERSSPRPSSGWSFALHHLLLTTPQSSVAIDSPSSSDTTRPQNANASPWCHFGAMASGVGRHRALGHLGTPLAPLAPSPSPSPTRSRLTSASRYLDGSPLAADGLGTGLINEMYDNVISLIEWHSLMVLRDYD